MQTPRLGNVVVPVTIENLEDLYMAERGQLPKEQVRSIEVPDALVDTGATGLLVPKRHIAVLGLRLFRTRQLCGQGTVQDMPLYSAVRLSIQGRECTLNVGEVPDDSPATIGRVPLLLLDWVVELKCRRLMGNPDHGGKHMMEVFFAA